MSRALTELFTKCAHDNLNLVLCLLLRNWKTALFVGVCAVTSCATTSTSQLAQNPGNGKALVYFIRDRFPPYMREAQLHLNEVQVATMADQDLVAVNIPLGNNDVEVTINGDKPFSFALPVTREERIYIELTGNVKWVSGRAYVKAGMEVMEFDFSRHVSAVRISRAEAETIASRIHKELL